MGTDTPAYGLWPIRTKTWFTPGVVVCRIGEDAYRIKAAPDSSGNDMNVNFVPVSLMAWQICVPDLYRP